MTNYEFELFDGEYFHTLNLINVDEENKIVTVAITYTGRISVKDFDLQQDNTGLYFEYGPLFQPIHINEFEYID